MDTSTAPPAETSGLGYEFQPELVAHARRILGRDRQAAEDIVQDAYVHLLRRTREGNPPRAPRPWLYTVVSSLCIREEGRARRQQPAEIESLAAPSADPAELALVRAEMRWALESVVALPEREQATLIADLAGVPQGHEGANARYQALHRARHKLRTLRAGAWALFPFPLIRWKLFGPGHAGVGAGGGGAPAVLATGGIAKGTIVAAAAVVALAGGQVVASIPAPGHPPPAAPVVAAPAGSAGSGGGPASAGGRSASPMSPLVAAHIAQLARSAVVGQGPSPEAAPSPVSSAPGAASPSTPAPSASPAPMRPSEPLGPLQDDAAESAEDEDDEPGADGVADKDDEPGGDEPAADDDDASAPDEDDAADREPAEDEDDAPAVEEAPEG